MKVSEVDVAVLLVFFTRHEQFARVFEQVKKAKPSRLFLYQDGPRNDHPDDVINIEKCRKIAENIDWECEVNRLYQEKNYGCDPSGYIAHTWAFSHADKCIVIEDDDVPSVSYFRFCKELLDKYEDDERIMLITGLNVDEETQYCPYDYFFTSTTFTVGCWASWRRVVSHWDKKYSFFNSRYYSGLIENYVNKNGFSKGFLASCKAHQLSNVEHFETIMICNQYLGHGLTIVPVKNMVSNIGLTGDATHTSTTLECLPKGYRKLFELSIFELDDKIKHQEYVIEDFSYKERAYKVYGWGNSWIKIYRILENSIYMMQKGQFKAMIQEWKNKLCYLFSKRIS